MSDRRLTPANGRVAAQHLKGIIAADAYVVGTRARIADPLVDLCATPDGRRDRQLLIGAGVTVFEKRDGWAFIQADADGYVGYVPETALGADSAPTHRVGTAATHAYEGESFKSKDLMHLPFGAQVIVTDERHKMFETNLGYIPKKHLRPLDQPFTDAPLRRGDLMFWKGHVGIMVDADVMLHANAHHMAAVYEPIAAAIIRIKAQGDGEVLARKRLT